MFCFIRKCSMDTCSPRPLSNKGTGINIFLSLDLIKMPSEPFRQSSDGIFHTY
ncbi:hypothetical protein NEIPOLOT_01400 [Neisseria polysaccharea ATCC 43768]|nr:hypothetical protein NEIPOLOT_01400 [Neisseria polysaccharea ATCC 43768]